MLRQGCEYTGEIENPDIFLDTVGEKIRICGHTRQNYMHIYINIENNRISEIKYVCTCDPAANVVVELLCDLVKGRTLPEAKALKPEDFTSPVGSDCGDDFSNKVEGILELLNRGIKRWEDK